MTNTAKRNTIEGVTKQTGLQVASYLPVMLHLTAGPGCGILWGYARARARASKVEPAGYLPMVLHLTAETGCGILWGAQEQEQEVSNGKASAAGRAKLPSEERVMDCDEMAYWEPDDFEELNRNEADDYRNEWLAPECYACPDRYKCGGECSHSEARVTNDRDKHLGEEEKRSCPLSRECARVDGICYLSDQQPKDCPLSGSRGEEC